MSLSSLTISRSAVPALCCTILTAWAVAVMIGGRALPWQASREWALLFAGAFLMASLWWWRYWTSIATLAGRSRRRLIAGIWGSGPFLIAATTFLGASYLSDGSYGVLMAPFFRMQFLVGAAALVALIESLQAASMTWLRDDALSVTAALRRATEGRLEAAIWISLVAIGILQGVARTPAIGDDLGQYIAAAHTLLDGLPYPTNARASEYVAIGVTPIDPALPALPVLLAASFAAFGRTLTAVAITFSVLKALFPIVAFVACRALTRSKTTAYGAAILLTLFPIYQVHVLSAPEPDTLFALLMLLMVALAARAAHTEKWPYWAGMGVAAGLVANTRHEGLTVSLAILLVFLALQRPKKLYAALLVPFLLALVPFALTSLSTSGLLWPTYSGTLSLSNAEPNLQLLRDRAFPWYVQAIGLDAPTLLLAVVVMAAIVGASLVFLWRGKRALVFVPLLGAGYIVASLLIHPRVLNPYSPTDVFRHWNTGIPYIVLSLAYALHAGYRALEGRLPGRAALALALAGLVITAGAVYYEAERLARPELYFGGQASLQGGGYLLTAVIQHPVPLPARDDPRSGEELRVEQAKPLEQYSLSVTNSSEPYHWTTLIVALFGLFYSAASSLLSRTTVEKQTTAKIAVASG